LNCKAVCLPSLKQLDDLAAHELLPLADRLEFGTELSFVGPTLSAPVARLLAACVGNQRVVCCSWGLPNLVSLEPESLAVLVSLSTDKSEPEDGWDIFVRFNGIKEMSVECARVLLSGHLPSFAFPYLASVTRELATAIAVNARWVEFGSQTTYELGALGILFTGKCSLRIEADQLAPFLGDLSFQANKTSNGSTLVLEVHELDIEAARFLTGSSFNVIRFTKLKTLSDEAAEMLATIAGKVYLDFPSLLSLSASGGHVRLAERLDSYRYRFQQAAPQVLECIAKTESSILMLDLTHLCEAGARQLAMYPGLLYLQELKSIDQLTAVALSRKTGKGIFLGMDQLEECTAEIFKQSNTTVTFTKLRTFTSWVRNYIMGEPHLKRLNFDWSHLESMHAYAPTILSEHGLPQLKHLSFTNEDQELTEFSFRSSHEKSPDIRSLNFSSCTSLRSVALHVLPVSKEQEQSISIQISDCTALETIKIIVSGRDNSCLILNGLPNCRKVEISLPDQENLHLLGDLANLEHLTVTGGPRLNSLAGIGQLSKLDSLVLVDCPKLESLAGVEALRSLRSLELRNCPQVKSLDPLLVLASFRQFVLCGRTSIPSLGPLTQLAVKPLIELDDVGVAVPPVLLGGLDVAASHAIHQVGDAVIECGTCGGRSFKGEFGGRYEQLSYKEVSYSKPLMTVLKRPGKKHEFQWLSQKLADVVLSEDVDIEDLSIQEGIDTRFSGYHGPAVRCTSCEQILDPMQIGLGVHDKHDWFSVISSDHRLSYSDDWKAVHGVLEHGVSTHFLRERGLRLPNKRLDLKRCPICADGSLDVRVSRDIAQESSGKCYVEVSIVNGQYRLLPTYFEILDRNVTSENQWSWLPDEFMSTFVFHLVCSDGCFEIPLIKAEDGLYEALGALALYEALQPNPDIERVALWMRLISGHCESLDVQISQAAIRLDQWDCETDEFKALLDRRSCDDGEENKMAMEVMRRAADLLKSGQI
jgi:hypothetical protein